MRPQMRVPSPMHGIPSTTRGGRAAQRQPVSCSCIGATIAFAAPVVVAKNGGIGKARRSVTQTSAKACRYTSHGASLAIVFGFGIDAQAGMP